MKVVKGPQLSDWNTAFKQHRQASVPAQEPGFESIKQIAARLGRKREVVGRMIKQMKDNLDVRPGYIIMDNGAIRTVATYRLKNR